MLFFVVRPRLGFTSPHFEARSRGRLAFLSPGDPLALHFLECVKKAGCLKHVEGVSDAVLWTARRGSLFSGAVSCQGDPTRLSGKFLETKHSEMISPSAHCNDPLLLTKPNSDSMMIHAM